MKAILFIQAVVLTAGVSLPVQGSVKSLSVKVDGLACPFCAYGLEKKLNKIEAVEKVVIDIDTGTAVVNVRADTRLVAASGQHEQASMGLVVQVQNAVEEGGFTPRAISATVEGQVVSQNGEAWLKLSGTEESLVLEESSVAELRKVEAGQPVQVVGVLHPETSPLRFTVENIISSESAALVCHLEISGMMCTGCVEAIHARLEKQEGVGDVQIDLESGLAEIVVEDESISGDALAELVNTLEMEGMPAGTFKATARKK